MRMQTGVCVVVSYTCYFVFVLRMAARRFEVIQPLRENARTSNDMLCIGIRHCGSPNVQDGGLVTERNIYAPGDSKYLDAPRIHVDLKASRVLCCHQATLCGNPACATCTHEPLRCLLETMSRDSPNRLPKFLLWGAKNTQKYSIDTRSSNVVT